MDVDKVIHKLELENDSLRRARAEKVASSTLLTELSVANGGINTSLQGSGARA